MEIETIGKHDIRLFSGYFTVECGVFSLCLFNGCRQTIVLWDIHTCLFTCTQCVWNVNSVRIRRGLRIVDGESK